MKVNKKTLLQLSGILKKLADEIDEARTVATESVKLVPLPIEQYLTPKARVSYERINKSTLLQVVHGEKIITLPCTYLSCSVYNDGLPSGAVPEKFLIQWAAMLNDLAENHGWIASMMPGMSIQLGNRTTAVWIDPEGVTHQPDPSLKERPQVAVCSYVFFDNYEKNEEALAAAWGKVSLEEWHKLHESLYMCNPVTFNKLFGNPFCQYEGNIGPVMEADDFVWRGALK
jgi:hypothetical protein